MPDVRRRRLGARHQTERRTAKAIGHYPPTVQWFHRGDSGPLAFVVSTHPNDIFLAHNLTDDELRHAVPHETCHLWQYVNTPDLTEAEAERAADEFAYQIADLHRDQRREFADQIADERSRRVAHEPLDGRLWTGGRAWAVG